MEQNIKPQIQTMRIIYSALIIGATLACAVLYVFRKEIITDASMGKSTGLIIFIVSNLFVIMDLIIGFLVIKKMMTFDSEVTIQTKLNKFRTALILRGAIFEAGCIVMMVCYLFTGNIVLVFEALILIGIMIFYFPGQQRIESELGQEINLN
jgi:hypothetical protein